MNLKIDEKALEIIKRLQDNNYESYIVGGAIRDHLLNIVPKDFDIATKATPYQIKKIFGSKAIIIGKRFKIVHIYFKKEYYEVTTFRSIPKKSNDKILANDNNWGTKEEDVQRRDFTVNALYFNPINGEILDFVNGINDLKEKKVVCIGNPNNRFYEDPIRMLRALKLKVQCNLNLDENVHQAILNNNHLLESCPKRRLQDELLKLTNKPNFYQMIQICQKYNLLQYLFPSCQYLLSQSYSKDLIKSLKIKETLFDKKELKSRAFIFAFFCYFYLEDKNKNEQLDSPAIRIHILNLLKPYILERHIPIRIASIYILVKNMLKFKNIENLNNNRQYFHAYYLFYCLNQALEWNIDINRYPLPKIFKYKKKYTKRK